MNRTEILASLGDLNALSSEIREINEANGWREGDRFRWDDPHKIPSALCLIHSEISEAWIGLEHEGEENYVEELADIAIRVLDMIDGIGSDPSLVVPWGMDIFPCPCDEDDEKMLLTLHQWTTEALEAFRKGNPAKFPGYLGAVMVAVLDICRFRGFALSAAIRAKLAKNRERGYRHGGKKV